MKQKQWIKTAPALAVLVLLGLAGISGTAQAVIEFDEIVVTPTPGFGLNPAIGGTVEEAYWAEWIIPRVE